MRVWLLAATLLVATLVIAPASAAPDDPECHDRGPIVDGGVAQVWLTRGCDPYVVFHEPSCWIGDLNICP